MARGNDRERKRSPKDAARRGGKKKVCSYCKDRALWVDYKDVNGLRRFMSDRGKIRARRVTGNCAQHQRDVSEAIKTARELALLPYTQRTVSERTGRGRGGDRGDRGGRGPATAVIDRDDDTAAPVEDAAVLDDATVTGEEDE